MEKNSMPPKTKPPPSESSEEESGSSEEGTEDEEQAEGGSDYESGSDTGTDTTKQKLDSILPTKQQSAGSNGKRTREANGRRNKEDEPPSKRNKPGVATPAPKAAPKPTPQQLEKKSTTKAEKGKPAPSGKEKPSKDLTAERDTKNSARKKPQSPPAAKLATASKSEQDTPQKPKVSSQPWSPDEELALSRELQKDRVNNVYGLILPSSRSDLYWEKLMGRFSFMDKYEKQQRIERLCEKVRRMRLRYESLNSRLKAGETSVWKNRHEEFLLGIWDTIWGPKKATPSMLNGDDDEEHEDEEEDGSDDEGSDEHDDEEIVRTAGKGRSSTVGRVTAQKKAISNKVVECSSDDESNEEDTPVKATPPAVLAAPGVPKIAATAATTVARKQASTSNAIPVKDPAPTAMDVNLNTTQKNKSQRAAVHNGAESGHAVIPPVVEKSVTGDSLPRDVVRAENLALLRDMRGTCVKMVEEAKTQSLLLSAKMLEETHAKTIQIVQEARVKSAQIMEELRLVVARVGTIAGQYGGMNGSHMGRCSDLSDNLFQGTGLLLGNGALPLGDPNNLDGKWREQSEAEHGLLLQRLQLVQEQSRIQQEGIRLKLNLRKQQT